MIWFFVAWAGVLAAPTLAQPAEELRSQERASAPAYSAWLASIRTGQTDLSDQQIQMMLSDGGGRRLLTRIAAVEHLRQHPHPELGAELMALFVRSRYGELPEDPDLFERALLAVEELTAQQQLDAVRHGLGPQLSRVVLADLHRRWLAPALADQTPQIRDWALSLPTTEPEVWASLQASVANDLEVAWAQHGPSLLRAMSVDGGSIADNVAEHIRDTVMAVLLKTASRPQQEILLRVSIDRGVGTPHLRSALQELSAASDNAEVRSLAAHALSSLPTTDLPALAPPEIPPGRTIGLEPGPPREPVRAFWTTGTGPTPPLQSETSHWLLGGAVLCLLFGIAGARSKPGAARASYGIGLGVGVLMLVEGIGRVADMPRIADTEPLLSFVDSGAVALEVPPTGEQGWRQTAGGSIRAALFPQSPQPGTLRVAFLGASTVHGSHVLAEQAFPAVAGATANDLLGDDKIEVLNLGVGGANSSVVRSAGEAALRAGARVLVIYYGHNEIDQMVRLGRYDGMNAESLGVRLALSRSVLYSMLRNLLPAPAAVPARHSVAPTQDRQSIAALKQLAEVHHRWNMEALLRRAARQSAQVILMTTATNYRFAHITPFASRGPGDAQDIAALLDAAQAAADRGDPSEARRQWQTAIDRGAWPREATSAINDTTRALASEYQCALLDVGGLFETRSPDGLTVSGLFWDDLHPTAAGHRTIGEALAPHLVEAWETLQ